MPVGHPIFWMLVAAVAAPLLAEIPIGIRLPVVVIEVVLGIVIGPHVLGLVRFEGFVTTMFLFGMASTLFMAGMELDFTLIRGRPLSLAVRGWVVSILLGFAAVGLLHVIPEVRAPAMVTIDAVMFGWFAPFFFVGTGVKFDIDALARDLTTMLLVPVFLVLFLAIRGAPVFLYRKDLARNERLPFALSSAVASLSIVVVITEIGVKSGEMKGHIAAALVGAALLSLLLFPTIAGALLSRVQRTDS